MATNPFFQNYDYRNTQELIDDLVIESIQIYGIDTVYLSRSLQGTDNILNEDDISIFNEAFQFEVYIKSVDGFEGEGDFLSRFGLQIRDTATFTVAIRTFEKFATRLNPTKTRPLEGDLIYLPLNDKFFKLTHVEHESVFYQSGALQVFDMKCELFEYSNERFDTKIEYIDTYFDDIKTDGLKTLGDLNQSDSIAKNVFFEEEGSDIIDFTEVDPFSEEIISPSTFIASADSTRYTADEANLTADTV